MPNNCPFPVYFRDRYPADLFRVHQRLTRPNCSQHVFTDYYYIIINCIIPYTSILSFLTGIPLIVLLKLKVKATNYYLHHWGIFILFSHITYFIITACQWLYYLINSKSLTISSDWMCKLMSSAFRFITYIQFNSTILIISRELLVYNRRLRRWSREFILMYSTPSRSIFWLMLSLSILLSILQTLPTYFVSQLKCDNHKHPTNNNNNNSTSTTGSDVVPHCQCIIQPIWSSISDDYRFWYKLHRIVFCEGVLPIVCLIFLSQKLLLKLKIHCLIVQAMRHDVSSGQGLHNTLQDVFNNTLGDSNNNLKILYIYTLALIISSTVYCVYYTLIYYVYSMNIEYNILRYYLDNIPTGLLFIDGLALVIRTISYNIFLILWYTYIPEINMLGRHLWCKLVIEIYATCRLIFRRSSDAYSLQYASKSHPHQHQQQQLHAHSRHSHRHRHLRRRQSRGGSRPFPYLLSSLNQTSFQSYQSDYSPPGDRNLPKKMEYYYAKLMNRSREGLESLKSRSKLVGLLRRKSSKQLE
ncbi:unnamed protein product [Trichobilharzia szidati]|nr:unnamed protein product [Trichobilharzia szidati]